MTREILCSIIATAGLAALPARAAAAEQGGRLHLSASERIRVEAIGGQARAGFNSSDELLNFRSTLAASYEAAPGKLFAELWDSRVYGGNRGTPVSTNEVNALELVQAFAEVRIEGAKGQGATVRLGRFLLNLGSRRLVAADDYRNTTNGYTGVRADWTAKPGWQASAIYTLPQQRRPDALLNNRVKGDHEGFDQVLWGGLLSKARAIGPATLEASFFHLGEHDRPERPTRDRSLDTLSLRIIREPQPARLDLEVEAIGQRGQASASLSPAVVREHVRAWFLHADIGYTFAGGWQPRLSVEYDHASGDRPGGGLGRFDTLFGMRRADLAPAGLYNAIARTNIRSPGLRLEAAPDKRTDWFVSYRPMWLASRFDSFASTGVRDASGRSGRFAGHQLDSRIRHKLTPTITLEADAVLLRKGRFLVDAPNAPPERWTRYLSLNLGASW